MEAGILGEGDHIVHSIMWMFSLNKATPIETPEYYSPYYGDPNPNFGKHPYEPLSKLLVSPLITPIVVPDIIPYITTLEGV